MKYFTKELWISANTGNYKIDDDLWQRNCREYVEPLEQLKHRLSKKAYHFFKRENLHDGRILSFIAGDDIDFDSNSKEIFDINSQKTTVVINVLNDKLNKVFRLKYTKLRRVLFDFLTNAPTFFWDKRKLIDDWGYDELTAADDDYLRHEILFSSGTTILIEFKHFTYSRFLLKNKPDINDETSE